MSTRKNYDAVIAPFGGKATTTFSFRFKREALKVAHKWVTKGGSAHVKSKRTGQVTHILQKQQTSCSVCGNELEGKQHCPLCGELHYYT